jgi:nucleotide-binding universal stress UspA family protein
VVDVKTIVVGLSSAETSHGAARSAVELATAIGATVHFVTALSKNDSSVVNVGSDRWEFSSLAAAEAEAARFVDSLGLSVRHTVSVLKGSPATILVDEAERLDADLIVVGNVRMQGPGRVLGSVGKDVAQHAPCSVLIVKTV